MSIERLDALAPGAVIETDIAIIGGGACGLTIARELIGSGLRVLVLESGLMGETAEHSALNAVEVTDTTWTEQDRAARKVFHSSRPTRWSEEEQRFGVRCRGLGGSTLGWAGKSASFDEIDFAERPWVPHSGWPISRSALMPYVDRAGAILNLGPNRYDDTLWQLMNYPPPKPAVDGTVFSSFFWQFSKSRVDPLDAMRMGADFAALDAPNVRVLLNATVLRLRMREGGGRFEALDVSTLEGMRASVRARACVLAASAIENARLLLLSNETHPAGLGNRKDLVGRYLTDHILTPLGRFDAAQAKAVGRRFGFYGMRHAGRSYMYSHGLALSAERQYQEGLLNGALFVMEKRSHDDPFSALARLVKGRSPSRLRDLVTLARSPVQLAHCVGIKLLENDRMPHRMRELIVETVIRRMPNRAAREYQFRGLPHKLDGALLQGICEQAPEPSNRVTLASTRDPFGQPRARINWRPGDAARRTLMRMGELAQDAFPQAGLPPPVPYDWIAERHLERAVVTDSGHTMGTTRMSDSPSTGVVDTDCRLHEVTGLYVAGGSVMPTSGHANPTLMMVALAIRLADHLRAQLRSA